MGMNTLRYQRGERQPLPMTYWRRRFLALVVGIVVLAMVAWAFSGVLSARGGGGPAASTGHGSHGPGTHGSGTHGYRTPGSGAHGSGAAASGASGSGGAPGSGAAPQASASSTPTSSYGPSAGPAPTSPSPGPAQAVGPAPSGPARACKPGDVVLSLFSSQDSYGLGQLPEFNVNVVSTSARTCAFNIGPKFLALVITAGRKRIWSSADCVAGRGSALTDLARGVPTVLPVSWARETSAPGCTVTSRPVPAGSFTAAASGGGLASNPVTFKLS
jgi:hypothetical protein